MFHLKNIFLCDCSQTERKSPPLRKKHICRPLHPHQNPRLQKSFSLPYFSPPPKKNKFPSPTPAYFQHTEQKSTAYNIVLLKCGVKVKIQYSVFLCHNCFFVPHFFINLVPRKKQLLHLVEFELKFFFRPHFSNTFSDVQKSPLRFDFCTSSGGFHPQMCQSVFAARKPSTHLRIDKISSQKQSFQRKLRQSAGRWQ